MPVQSTQRERGKQLTDIEIAKILGCSKAGAPQRTIAEWLKATKTSVQRALTMYSFDTFQGRKPRREYQRATTEREDRYIERALKQNSDLPLKDITNIIDPSISTATLRRRRTEAGLGSFVVTEKPGLRPENMEARLAWAQRYKDWTIEDWKRVIWSDESSIWIGVNPRRRWVIRPPGERLNPQYMKRTYKTAHVKVMVWACFTGERIGPLIVCDEGGVGANEYEDILYDGLFSLLDDLLESPDMAETEFIFMQDNAPCHKATAILEFLQENKVPIMEWPAQSPDLNPIENLWVDFKARFHKQFTELFSHPSKSAEARYRYSAVLEEVWYSQGQEMIDALLESMPRRVQAVLEANGGWTKY